MGFFKYDIEIGESSRHRELILVKC